MSGKFATNRNCFLYSRNKGEVIFHIETRLSLNCSCPDCGLCTAVISVLQNKLQWLSLDVFGQPWSYFGQACNNCQHYTAVTFGFNLLCSLLAYFSGLPTNDNSKNKFVVPIACRRAKGHVHSKGTDESLDIIYISVLILKIKRPEIIIGKCIKVIFSRGSPIPVARSPWRLHYGRCCPMFVGPQYGTSFISLF